MPASKFYAKVTSTLAALVFAAVFIGCSEQRGADSKKNVEVKPRPDEPGIKIELAKLKIGKCTLTGPVREFNDDDVAVHDLPDATLCLVADGMGGIVSSKIVGKIAAERFRGSSSRAQEQSKERPIDRGRARSFAELWWRPMRRSSRWTGPRTQNGGTTLVLGFRNGHEGVRRRHRR